jgi:hypothetical protein
VCSSVLFVFECVYVCVYETIFNGFLSLILSSRCCFYLAHFNRINFSAFFIFQLFLSVELAQATLASERLQDVLVEHRTSQERTIGIVLALSQTQGCIVLPNAACVGSRCNSNV